MIAEKKGDLSENQFVFPKRKPTADSVNLVGNIAKAAFDVDNCCVI